jgi:hypothetical protein
MANGVITAGMVIVALYGGFVLFRIEARQHRTSLVKPGSYRFGVFGMVVYLVLYGVLTVIEKVCFTMGKASKFHSHGDLIYDPKFFWHPWNVFYEDGEE